MNGEDQPLPIGRYIVGNPRPVPFSETGDVSSYIGSNNIQQNRTLSGRMPTTKYNSAIPNIRATEENNGSKPQIVSPADTGTAATCQSLGLYFEENGTLWITEGFANGEKIESRQLANSGSGIVYVETIIDKTNGEIVQTNIIARPIVDGAIQDTETNFYFAIGFYTFGGAVGTGGVATGPSISQYHCGSVWGYSCRVNYASPARFAFRYYS